MTDVEQFDHEITRAWRNVGYKETDELVGMVERALAGLIEVRDSPVGKRARQDIALLVDGELVIALGERRGPTLLGIPGGSDATAFAVWGRCQSKDTRAVRVNAETARAWVVLKRAP